MKKLVLLFTGLFLFSLLHSQDKQTDSLKTALKRAKHDTVKCKVLIELANISNKNEGEIYSEELHKIILNHSLPSLNAFYKRCLAKYYYYKAVWDNSSKDYVSAHDNYKKSLQLSRELKDTTDIILTQFNLALIFKKTGSVSRALECLYEGLQLSEARKDSTDIIFPISEIALIYFEQKDYSNALMAYDKLLKIAMLTKDDWAIAFAQSRIARVYWNLKNKSKALDYFKTCIKTHEENKNNAAISNIYSDISKLYKEEGNVAMALEYINKSLDLNKKENDTIEIATALNNIGVIYKENNEALKALDYLKQSLKIKSQLKDKELLVPTLNHLGNVYFTLKEYSSAIKAGEQALQIGESLGIPEYIKNSSELLFKAYVFANKPVLALDMQKKYLKMRDSLNSQDILKTILKNQFENEIEKREGDLKLQASVEKKIMETRNQEEKKRQNIILYSVLFGLIIVSVFAFLIFRSLQKNRQANKVITAQKIEVEEKSHLIEEKQKEILDSINYAKRIQYTLLAHADFLKENIPDHFVYFNPKDIVSGDFYWAAKKGNKFYLAVCDSTGHGVPGAFMSLLNIGFLTEAINEKGIEEPNKVFDFVRQRLIDNISKEGQKDGFDGILICIDKSNNSITYSAANNSPILVQDNKLTELESDRMPVGMGERKDNFKLFSVDAKSGDSLYLYTDGYADQFGGPKGKKYKYKQLHEMLLKNSNKPLDQQKEIIINSFENWKGNLEQVDDVCVIGIKL